MGGWYHRVAVCQDINGWVVLPSGCVPRHQWVGGITEWLCVHCETVGRLAMDTQQFFDTPLRPRYRNDDRHATDDDEADMNSEQRYKDSKLAYENNSDECTRTWREEEEEEEEEEKTWNKLNNLRPEVSKATFATRAIDVDCSVYCSVIFIYTLSFTYDCFHTRRPELITRNDFLAIVPYTYRKAVH